MCPKTIRWSRSQSRLYLMVCTRLTLKRFRCVIVPHIASATLETRRHMATYAAQNLIAALLGGDMPAQVDLSAC